MWQDRAAATAACNSPFLSASSLCYIILLENVVEIVRWGEFEGNTVPIKQIPFIDFIKIY